MNVIVLFVRVWGRQYRVELILNINVPCEGLSDGNIVRM